MSVGYRQLGGSSERSFWYGGGGIRQVNGRRQRKRCTKIEQTREKSHKGAAKAKEGGGADGMVCPGLWLT